jgi:hypothetical protein
MKKLIFTAGMVVIILSSCNTLSDIPKSTAYKGMYENVPLSILIMPPINRSTNVESKEYFHSSLTVPIANAGYYVIPSFLSMEILKRESAYDAEMFIHSSLSKFREVFGADIALFTIIHKWNKSGIASLVYVEVEYIMKSTITNEILYTRRGNVTYDASVSTGTAGAFGALADLALSAINTATTDNIEVARACNAYTFKDLPAGKYSPDFKMDGEEMSGIKDFNVMLDKSYR